MNNTKLASFLVLGALTLSALDASAGDGKAYPGSLCQTQGSSQQLYYGSFGSGALIANRTASTRSAVCPLVRDVVSGLFQSVRVYVRDRHSRLDIKCQVRGFDAFGQTVYTSPMVSSSGEGFDTLVFGPALAQSNWGPLVLSCQLPPMEGNVPSYIASYRILE